VARLLLRYKQTTRKQRRINTAHRTRTTQINKKNHQIEQENRIDKRITTLKTKKKNNSEEKEEY